MNMRPKISIITSVYKKDTVGVKQISKINNVFSKSDISYEFIVVIDGLELNKVAHAEIREFLTKSHIPHTILINRANKGKGFSIRKGIKNASGEYLLITDADLDVEMKTFKIALKALRDNDGIDCVIPSKFHPDSEVNATGYRQILSKGFQLYSRTMLPTPANVNDVSCGMKIYKKSIVDKFLSKLCVNRFAMDSEMLYHLYRNNATVVQIPFHTSLGGDSTAANIGQILDMVKNIAFLSIKARLLYLSEIKLVPGRKMFYTLSTKINL